MARPTTAHIDLSAIRHNYQLAKRLAPNSKALAVVKADAYGHGAQAVAQALQGEADGFAVAAIEEAIELRESGITKPILLLEGFFDTQELDQIALNNLSCVVHSTSQVEQLCSYTGKGTFDLWLKIDIGMHRLGLAPSQFETALSRLSALSYARNITLMGHFSCADDLASSTTIEQRRLFERCTSRLNLPTSLSNSAAILGWPTVSSDWVRPGLMLYGATPYESSQEQADQLLPAMTLQSEVIAIRTINAGEAVGYGGSWIASRPTRVGTVAVGYADGYPRQTRSGAPVIVGGQRTQLIGRVSMDMITVDLTDLPSAQVGTPVELFGRQLTADELAPWADTIPYTLFTGITRRVLKRYRD